MLLIQKGYGGGRPESVFRRRLCQQDFFEKFSAVPPGSFRLSGVSRNIEFLIGRGRRIEYLFAVTVELEY